MAASQGLNGGVQLFSHPGSGGAAKSMRSIGLPLVVRLPVSPLEAATPIARETGNALSKPLANASDPHCAPWLRNTRLSDAHGH